MKRIEYINELLDKYFEGQTSLEEEEALREYFSGKNIAAKHLEYAPIFGFFIKEREKIYSKNKKNRLYYWIGAAACIVLLVGVGLRFQMNNGTPKSMMYIDGEKISNEQVIGEYTLKSINSITDMNKEAIDAQFSILDMFDGQ